MIKRTNRLATLLVAATAVSTIVPAAANAAEIKENSRCFINKCEKNEDNE